MKQNIKGIIFIGVSLVTLISAYNLYVNNYIGYAILCATFAFIFMLFGIGFLIYENDPEKLYQNNVRNILNTYDSILEKGNEMPKLTGKNIIVVTSMDDMVDVQNTIKKPIFYYKQTESCSFVLLSSFILFFIINYINKNIFFKNFS